MTTTHTPDMIQLTPVLQNLIHKLIDHTSHYASFPAAHSDAYKDAANARAELAKAIGEPTSSI